MRPHRDQQQHSRFTAPKQDALIDRHLDGIVSTADNRRLEESMGLNEWSATKSCVVLCSRVRLRRNGVAIGVWSHSDSQEMVTGQRGIWIDGAADSR